jgi:hypothetical protein
MIRKNIIIILISIFPFGKLFAQAPYLGGNGNGFSNTISTISLSITDSTYNGGNGNGFNQQLQTSLSFLITDSLYNGGNADGFHSGISTALNLIITDSVYNGGNGRGEGQLLTTVNLDHCGSDTLIWNGNTNSVWSNPGNWDCGVPGINTTVFIPGGLTRYPVIFSSQEIKKLIIQPGASCIVQSGTVLKLNGQ